MGREVRMVAADWKHPKNDKGKYIPLHEGNGAFEKAEAEWNEGYAKWQEGLCESYGTGEKWKPIDSEYVGLRYSDYSGTRPSPDDFMPNWPAEKRTHYMMYEDTSEGTPLSPAFPTPEELAKWLVANNASAFGGETASYEAWLRVCKGGWAPSCVVQNGQLYSGVEALVNG
jgi:hypothetical protein